MVERNSGNPHKTKSKEYPNKIPDDLIPILMFASVNEKNNT